MALSKTFLLNALIRQNFFPSQKKRREEFPPVFTTNDITKTIADEVHKVQLSKDRKKNGFDVIQYKSTRFNNVPRIVSIPHPKSYIDLCFEIFDNWKKIKHICANPNSLILPKAHKDGRVIIMDYEKSSDERNRFYKSAFGKKFLAKADIANCYPSIYTHVIPWALVGFQQAKKNRNPSEWYNKIDTVLRSCCRNETTGISIGPATSNIVCEIILERIDHELRKKFKFVRFIDDYTAYCKTHTEAEEFIRQLSNYLVKYKLSINIKKTEISALPLAISNEWIGRMREIIPSDKVITATKVSNILDAAIRLQKNNPDGSILKYAANSIVKKLDNNSSFEFIKYIIKLCFHYPVLIPTIKNPLAEIYNSKTHNFKKELVFLLKDSIKYGRSDSICWLLYYLLIYNIDIPDTIADKLIKLGDSMALALLAEFHSHERKVIKFVKTLDKKDLYELDAYWLLLYQLFLKGKIKNPYNDKTFSILKKNKVSFIKF